MPRVELYVYDLSQGMAAMMSVPLTGKYIAGIFHTAVVVFGKEVYFGQGITVETPQTTPHGTLLEKIDMGETQIPENVFWEYIDSMRATWTADKYHLFDNNCNSFSQEVCIFLVGKEIPSHITGLPREFLSTPFGMQIAPMIEQMFGPSRVAAEHRSQHELFSSNVASTMSHEHDKFDLPTLKNLPKSQILFSESSNSELIFGKLTGFVESAGLMSDCGALFDSMKLVLESKVKVQQDPLPSGWWSVFEKCVSNLKQEQLFPLIDVLRLLVLHEPIALTLISPSSSPSPLMTLFSRFQTLAHAQQSQSSKLPKSLHMMLLRLACNLFAHQSLVQHVLALHLTLPPTSTPHRTVITAVLVDALLSPEESVRQCASSLAFNMALEAALGRPAGEDQVYEEWCLEMVAAIVKALENEQTDDIALRLIHALGHLLFRGPVDVVSMASVLGAVDILEAAGKKNAELDTISQELRKLL